jgi:branched-chain amino acid transport system ATP-binding protein
MLAIENVETFYGGIAALSGVSLHVREGEIVALIGSNGAGKSTLLNVVSGLVKCQRGRILFMEEEITNRNPEKIVDLGIGQVPEGRQLFNPLTVVENLEMGGYLRYKKGLRQAVDRDIEYVLGLFPPLRERQEQLAGTLSGGEQQMLSIGRALMGKPKLLLLDEPSLGLAPLLVQEIFRVVKRLKEEESTILLVEQNARAALRIGDRGYVLETGRITLEGKGRDLLANDQVKTAYLGKSYREISGEKLET